MRSRSVGTDTEQKLELGVLQRYADLLDSSIRIPGTQWTIGLDPIIGLIPVVGDLAGYLFSILILFKCYKLGASKMLILKMFGNITLDATIGSIPILGLFFDFAYKSNERNLRLFKEYHTQGKHRESTLPFFLGLFILTTLFVIMVIYLLVQLYAWIF
ncbi:MAG: DUF4112 domain-containing protein [Flavobacteriales bacterium]|nr:DUF4112 domain-containing protein [Flavobacteriales bacterium]